MIFHEKLRVKNNMNRIAYCFIDSVSSFSIGLSFFYWKWFDPKKLRDSTCKEDEELQFVLNHNDYSGYSRDELFVEKAKFRDLREEAVESGHCSLAQFAAMVVKAKELMKTIKVKGLRARPLGHAEHYGVMDGSPITLRHIQSLLLYTDFTKLQSIFSKTLRPDHLGESLDSIKARNASWFEMSKLLRETVECFGNTFMEEHGPFYSGVNHMMLVSSFGIRLCSPTSTSKAQSVAVRFADTHGMVMQFNNEDLGLKFFDCSYFSSFTEEDERLFFGGDYRTRVESVSVIQTRKNYQKYFRIFYAFDLMLSGSYQTGLKLEIASQDEQRLKWFIHKAVNEVAGSDCDGVHDEYVIDTFNAYITNKRNIVINFDLMEEYYSKSLYQEIVHYLEVKNFYRSYKYKEPEDTSMNMIRWKRLFALFSSLETLTIYTTNNDAVSSYPFSLKQFPSIFAEFECIKVVEIKAVHFRGNNSWIHDAFAVAQAELNQNMISTTMRTAGFGGDQRDILKIQRK